MSKIKFTINIVLVFLLFSGCRLGKTRPSTEYYYKIATELKKEPGALAECQCLPGMSRDPAHLEQSLRGEADRKAVEFLSAFSASAERPTLFFIGSGKLLNETTILASLMNARVSPRIVLIDSAYESINVRKSEASADTSEALETALAKFKKIISHFSQSYEVKADIRIFDNFSKAFKEVTEQGEKVHAFFMLDVFFPFEYAEKYLQDEILQVLKANRRGKSWDSLFFFLGKKDDGDIKYPVNDTDKKPPTMGRDPAVLDIYRIEIKNGEMTRKELLFQKIE